MEKLELKYLAPYLPYRLKIKGNTHGEIEELSCVTETSVNIYGRGFKYGMWGDILDIKPLLRPLSQLTEEITHNEETFVPIVELLKLAHPQWYKEHFDNRYSDITFSHDGWYIKACFEFMATKDISIHTGFMWNIPFWISEKLNEWHFDWKDNLIEKGLAEPIK